VLHDISEENELMRPSGLIYYEDLATSLFGIPSRAIICFNHSDLERERTARLKKIGVAEIKVAEILSSQTGNETLESLEKEIKAVIRGVSDYFEINNDGNKITVNPHAENRKNARLRDGKCLIFTTNFEKSASEIIATYFGKDIIEKIFDCFKNWLDLQPVRHFEEGNIDVYIFICYLAYLVLALYKHHLGVTGWEGVEDSLDELGRIRKTTLDFGGESGDKISVLLKSKRRLSKSWGLRIGFSGCSLYNSESQVINHEKHHIMSKESRW